MQVNFLICGAQKAGTTTLAAYCRQHPGIGMPEEKELHFFDQDEYFLSSPDYGLYHRHFAGLEQHAVIGEATPVYMYWPGVPERIRQYNPDMKLVILLRNPVERAYSHWQMEYDRHLEPLDFGVAIRQERQRLETAGEKRRVWSYMDRGFYSRQLDNIFTLFGREQVLVLKTEDLKSSAHLLLSKVSAFLGVAPFPEVSRLALNTQEYSRPMPKADRIFLEQQFASEITTLEQLLGWDLTSWRPCETTRIEP